MKRRTKILAALAAVGLLGMTTGPAHAVVTGGEVQGIMRLDAGGSCHFYTDQTFPGSVPLPSSFTMNNEVAATVGGGFIFDLNCNESAGTVGASSFWLHGTNCVSGDINGGSYSNTGLTFTMDVTVDVTMDDCNYGALGSATQVPATITGELIFFSPHVWGPPNPYDSWWAVQITIGV